MGRTLSSLRLLNKHLSTLIRHQIPIVGRTFVTLVTVLATTGLFAGNASAVVYFSHTGIETDGQANDCISADGTAGHLVYGKTCSTDNGNQEYMSSYQANICGGGHIVTTSPACPFANNSGLNNRYHNDNILYLKNDHFGTYYAESAGGQVMQESGTNTGSVWVADNDCGNGQSGENLCHFVNVHYSSSTSLEDTICDEGTNQPLGIEESPAITTDRCYWGLFVPIN